MSSRAATRRAPREADREGYYKVVRGAGRAAATSRWHALSQTRRMGEENDAACVVHVRVLCLASTACVRALRTSYTLGCNQHELGMTRVRAPVSGSASAAFLSVQTGRGRELDERPCSHACYPCWPSRPSLKAFRSQPPGSRSRASTRRQRSGSLFWSRQSTSARKVTRARWTWIR